MAPVPAISLTEKQSRFEFLSARFVLECSLQGIVVVCYRHRSTLAEDLAYFEKGLSQIDPRITPTMHMAGLAKDYFLVIDGKDNWLDIDTYKRMGAVAEGLGLTWGGSWKTLKDYGHVEYREES